MLDELMARHALRSAFERVRENGGCRGADGVTLETFADRLETELDSIEASLRRGSYHPLPLLQFKVPKPTSGERPLAVPTVRDRVVQTAVYLLTRDRFEAELEDTSFAYRLGRSVRDAVRCVDGLREQGYRWVVDADVDRFFEEIDHERLLTRLAKLGLDPYVERLFALWIRAEIYDGRRVCRLRRGIPQGSVVSPMLANLFLDELDENLLLFGQKVVRYADDFVILCKTAAGAEEALELTDYLLGEMALVLDPEKTRITSFDQGFRFLGAVFLKDAVLRPFEQRRPEPVRPYLPPPLDLLSYLELRGLGEEGEERCPSST